MIRKISVRLQYTSAASPLPDLIVTDLEKAMALDISHTIWARSKPHLSTTEKLP